MCKKITKYADFTRYNCSKRTFGMLSKFVSNLNFCVNILFNLEIDAVKNM